MQLTRFDRWLLEEFVHETHIYTLSAPPTIPRGIREIPVPDTPGRRFQHHFVGGNSRSTDALVAVLRASGQMFSTQVTDRKAWYVPFIAPKGQSVTWRLVWIVAIANLSTFGIKYLSQFWNDPTFRENILDAFKTFQG
jgi:hypothetical protein